MNFSYFELLKTHLLDGFLFLKCGYKLYEACLSYKHLLPSSVELTS